MTMFPVDPPSFMFGAVLGCLVTVLTVMVAAWRVISPHLDKTKLRK